MQTIDCINVRIVGFVGWMGISTGYRNLRQVRKRSRRWLHRRTRFQSDSTHFFAHRVIGRRFAWRRSIRRPTQLRWSTLDGFKDSLVRVLPAINIGLMNPQLKKNPFNPSVHSADTYLGGTRQDEKSDIHPSDPKEDISNSEAKESGWKADNRGELYEGVDE